MHYAMPIFSQQQIILDGVLAHGRQSSPAPDVLVTRPGYLLRGAALAPQRC